MKYVSFKPIYFINYSKLNKDTPKPIPRPNMILLKIYVSTAPKIVSNIVDNKIKSNISRGVISVPLLK